MVERPEHRRVIELLSAMDAELLERCGCWFGGGTAVSIRCNEPRVSRDVDFLCSSHDGYRKLRNHVFGRDARALFRDPVDPVRELRADRYGVRTAVRIGDVVIKVELVSEGRIELESVADSELPVRRLTDSDLIAEKLLANVDRGLDDASLGRDVIDLMLLELTIGELPHQAFEKARSAYGDAVDRAFATACDRLDSDSSLRERCFASLGIDDRFRAEVTRRLRR